MKCVFGPVPSRRLGQSLGIDTIPLKTCNWNCVYCQLGRTVPMTNERKEYIPREELLAQVQVALASHRSEEIDWVTFVGSGEPTLHSGLGDLIRQVKSLTDKPVAVITNGALLYRPEVRQELSAADAVLPSLDAGNQQLYCKINRPWPELTFERQLEGLSTFRQEYAGKLWVEVMLVEGLNDTEKALCEIAATLSVIKPDRVHLGLPTRPPAEAWVHPPDEDGLLRARAILGKTARVVHPAAGLFDLSGYNNLTDAIMGIISRHPMREDELIRTLERYSPSELRGVLEDLIASGQAQIVTRYGARFWCALTSFFPDNSHSQRTIPSEHLVSRKTGGSL
jgi:wyosine [tRNA(Phe)-imidazoG37] synthetase (radical SAM superfamily)